MKSYIQYRLDNFSSIEGELGACLGHWLRLLTNKGNEQDYILNWCKTSKLERINRNTQYEEEEYIASTAGFKPDEWEVRLCIISDMFGRHFDLPAWETMPNKERGNHVKDVVTHAKALAKALEQQGRPEYPPLIELFDSKLFAGLSHLFDKRYFDDEGNIFTPDKDKVHSAEGCWYIKHVVSDALRGQDFPGILRTLAVIAEESLKQEKREKRFNKGNPNARAFAKRLTISFRYYFECTETTPWEVIAKCVSLRYPDCKGLNGQSLLRDWHIE